MISLLRLVLLLPFLFGTNLLLAQKLGKKTKVEAVAKICDGLPMAEKPVVAIMPFKLAAPGASQQVGTGLPDMMVNALFNSGCFRVVERERMADIMKEQGMGLSGAGDESSFAQVGKMAGAQILIFGTITEFKENESGGGGGAGALLPRRRGLGALIGGVGAKTAHVGYTLKFVNPSTGEILDSKSFDKKRTSVGAAGGGLFGAGIAGGAFYSSKSMQDAIEESLIEAVQYMSQNKSNYTGIVQESKANTEANSFAKVDKKDCALLKVAHKPKIMVIIPEEHLAGVGSKYDPLRRNDININVTTTDANNQSVGTSSEQQQSDNNNNKNMGSENLSAVRTMFRPPDPAGETEIMKRFLEYGFELVDAKQYEKLRAEKTYQNAFENPAIASQIAKKFGADIILVGEAFSEYSKAENGMSSCRARVEVKAIMTKNAKILAADGLHGSGMDISEVIAGKTALRNAGTKVADYFLAQLCAKADDIAADMGGKSGAISKSTSSVVNETEITFTNADFNKATSLGKLINNIPGVSEAERLSFEDNTAIYKVSHTCSVNTLIEKLVANKSLIKLNVKSLSGNSAIIEVK